MTDRAERARAFLAEAGWQDAARRPLAGDASNRRYERLVRPGGETAVFMDAPPDRGEDVRPFLRIARHLAGIGLSAPAILAEDPSNGFLLLEDLGDDLFSSLLAAAPEREAELYACATDVLVHLHAAPMPALARYDAARMAELAVLAFSKYRDIIAGAPDPEAQTLFMQRFEALLREAAGGRQVLIQRDYHADNLLWLPQRSGVARVGLLDFQDAMAGHPAYDLISLLQDVRRDVSKPVEAEMIARYVAATGAEDKAFRTACAVLGAQRSLRILGVFARLGSDYGKPQYVDMIPKTWDVLMQNLAHPALEPVADLLRSSLPEPSPAALARLKPA